MLPVPVSHLQPVLVDEPQVLVGRFLPARASGLGGGTKESRDAIRYNGAFYRR